MINSARDTYPSSSPNSRQVGARPPLSPREISRRASARSFTLPADFVALLSQAQQRWAERLSQLRFPKSPYLRPPRKASVLAPANRFLSRAVSAPDASKTGSSSRARAERRPDTASGARVRRAATTSAAPSRLSSLGRRSRLRRDDRAQDCLTGLHILAEQSGAMPTLTQELLRILSQRSMDWVRWSQKAAPRRKRGA